MDLPTFLLDAGFRRVPLFRMGVGHFQIAGQLNGRDLAVLIDTAAASTVFSLKQAKKLGLTLRRASQPALWLSIWNVAGYLLAIRPIKPVIDASSSGSAPGCSRVCYRSKLAEDLRDRGKLDLSEAFIDASFSSAKKGALVWALQNAAKAAKSWQSQTAMVFLSPCTWSALRRMKPRSSNPRSSGVSFRETPPRLIGDKAYDSDPLDQRVRQHFRVELIAPHRWNRSKPVTQDGRVLRRYRRRWKIERLFALAP